MFTNTVAKRIYEGLNIGHWEDNDIFLNERYSLEVLQTIIINVPACKCSGIVLNSCFYFENTTEIFKVVFAIQD